MKSFLNKDIHLYVMTLKNLTVFYWLHYQNDALIAILLTITRKKFLKY